MSLFIYYLPAWASDSDKHKEIKYHSAQFYPSTYLPQLSREVLFYPLPCNLAAVFLQ